LPQNLEKFVLMGCCRDQIMKVISLISLSQWQIGENGSKSSMNQSEHPTTIATVI